MLSVEPFTAAEQRPSTAQLHQLMQAVDIFSPNELEAESMVGPGAVVGMQPWPWRIRRHCFVWAIRIRSSGVNVTLYAGLPEELVGRLINAAGPSGASTIVLRRGEHGSLIASRPHTDGAACWEGWAVPAVEGTQVVDVTGCGNAFCGGFLASLDQRQVRLRSNGEVLSNFLPC